MIQGLQSHPTYKSSGVDWLGDVPSHWEVRRLRTVAEMRVSNVDKHVKDGELPVRLCNYVDVYKNDRITEDIAFMRATATASETERFRLEVGDVLITKDSETWNDIGVPALVEHTAGDLVCGYHLALLRPSKISLDGAFLLRALQNPTIGYQFHISAKGVTRYGLTHEAVKSVLVPLPPLHEQRAIARYLDHVDRRIQRYIEAKEKLITLLQEARQAIIHRAVTRGLDLSVPLKPSGVEWLGDMPAHWEVRRLRYLIEGGLIYGANAAAEHDNPNWPRYLRITDFGLDGKLRDDTFRSLPPETAKDYLVKPDDLLLARSGATVGKAFLVTSEIGQACHAGYLIRARPKAGLIDPGFLFAFTQSSAFSCWKDSVFIIATIQNISAEKYASLPVPTPPLEEQKKIVVHLDEATAAIDAAIDTARRQVEFMTEYRASLIAHVVTGKLDVRAAAEQLPQESSQHR